MNKHIAKHRSVCTRTFYLSVCLGTWFDPSRTLPLEPSTEGYRTSPSDDRDGTWFDPSRSSLATDASAPWASFVKRLMSSLSMSPASRPAPWSAPAIPLSPAESFSARTRVKSSRFNISRLECRARWLKDSELQPSTLNPGLGFDVGPNG